ncbi:MAG: bifunctional heptose 7-phosphate kinase/heptose 1-phosphate adenyltransferase [Candidatus Nanoarchaeia archaeon]
MENLRKVVDEFEHKTILVLGDVILDKFSWGKVKGINPEQPTATNLDIDANKDTYALGGASNVANNISSLNANCKLYGAIGKDEEGEKLKKLCEEKNIEFKGFEKRKKTNTKWRTMAHGQQTQRMNFGEGEPKISQEIQAELLKELENEIKNFDFVILSDYNKGFFDETLSQKIINLTNFYKIPTHIDLKPENISYFKNCTIISPNEIEAEKITGIKYFNNSEALLRMAKALIEIVNPKYIVITCGEDGVFAYDVEKEKYLMVKTNAKEVYDVAGAGDTFAAVFSLGMASGLGLFDSVKIANYASGIVVEKIGVETVNTEEMKKRIEENG